MSNRSIRVNELVKREISTLLHTAYRSESTGITITEVSIAPDLRAGRVYYSVLGEAEALAHAARFFKRAGTDIQQSVAKTVVLKYTPKLRFLHDPSLERGAHILQILDDIEPTSPGFREHED